MTYEELLEDLSRRDDRIVVMTAENRAAIRNLPDRLGDRFIDVGIAEMTMVGAAAGLALRGRIPVVHALAAFLTMRAFEFIRTDVGIPSLPVKLVGGVPGLLSEANGPTHQAIEDIALMRGIPSMRVFSPADNDDMVAGLEHILADPSPWYIRFNATPATVIHEPFAVGRSETFGDGRDITMLTHGFLFNSAIEAMEHLRMRGIAASVVNLRTVVPLDEDAVIRCLDESDLVVTLEDHFETGGLTTMVAELMMRQRLNAPVRSIAFRERWFRPGLLNDVLRFEGMTGEAIADTVMEELVTR